MKILKILIFSILLMLPVYSHAIYGGQPGAMFAYGADAHSFAMGRAYAAYSTDASAVYNNPASLMEVPKISGLFMQANMFSVYSFSVMAFVWPGLYESYGGGMVTLGNSLPIVKTDDYNEESGSVADSSSAMVLAYGKRLYNNLSVGLSFKNYSRALGEFPDSFFVFDLGVLYSPMENIVLGGVLNNVYSMNNAPAITSDKLPLIWRGGLAYKSDEYCVAFDVTDTFSQWYLGAEYKFMGMFSLLAGMNYEEAMTFGLGVEYSIAKFDIAMANQDAGSTMKFSLGINLGGNKSEEVNTEVDNYVAKGMRYFDKGFYNLAKESYSSISILKPLSSDNKKQLQKLNEVLAITTVKLPEERQAWECYDRAISAMRNKELKRALEEAKKAEGFMPSNSNIGDLVQFLEKNVGILE
ncbi:MAG: hypothetical protein DKM50_01190 [Candidatus Margulisiibacteriota bacterium]|nr:MAG: hypothetical protein DKM50_01190 [Candidatus Margulisiibacteriota bacterium]HAR63759.1 hypothetical protein [Candidatus Margulisiibacteriota bacterium]